MAVHEVPGILVVEWNEMAKAIIDRWASYGITVDQFREAILQKGVAFAKAHGGRAWIMDASQAKGAFSQEVQNLIATEVFPMFASIGVKYFVTVKSASTITNLSIGRYTANLGPNGLQMVEVPDVKTALEWVKAHR